MNSYDDQRKAWKKPKCQSVKLFVAKPKQHFLMGIPLTNHSKSLLPQDFPWHDVTRKFTLQGISYRRCLDKLRLSFDSRFCCKEWRSNVNYSGTWVQTRAAQLFLLTPTMWPTTVTQVILWRSWVGWSTSLWNRLNSHRCSSWIMEMLVQRRSDDHI